MKKLLILSLMLISVSALSQSMKAQAKPKAASPQVVIEKKAAEVPCDDTKEDILKKLEEKKKAQAKVNKGFSLQGGNDTGCSL